MTSHNGGAHCSLLGGHQGDWYGAIFRIPEILWFQLIYGRPNRSADGGLRDIIYSVECEFFVDVCLCYHNSNDTYYVRIKNDGIRPLRTYASQLDYYTPGSMQLDGGDYTYLSTWRCKRNMSVAPLLISAVASGHLKLNKFYFGFCFFIGLIQYFWIEFRYSYLRLLDDVST